MTIKPRLVRKQNCLTWRFVCFDIHLQKCHFWRSNNFFFPTCVLLSCLSLQFVSYFLFSYDGQRKRIFTALGKLFCGLLAWGYFIWSRIPGTTFPLRQLYQAFVCENVDSAGRVEVDPAWLSLTFIEKSNVQIALFVWVSPGHPITVGFAELNFTCLIMFLLLRKPALLNKARWRINISKTEFAYHLYLLLIFSRAALLDYTTSYGCPINLQERCSAS